MMTSLIASVMNMTADVWVQKNTQSESGAITREWVYDKTIPCKVLPFRANTTGRSDNKIFSASADYEEHMRLTIKCLEPISKRSRVTNIRANDGKSVYFEIDRYDTPPTIFDVVGSHTVLDPFGRVSYYDISIQRTAIQNDSTQLN